ncbi:hypothetical protein CcCBS67573_g00760 [Chytriomyces confervae]|uniref:Uncharacterized protein n=1 Tax=Chytriomyces confervae TaxID=246404 RepID=A0A507FQV6_9FUNG|nr:hypothetical protein CcCBS67573_g00760 [Chytriomyces confervae]
MAIRHAETSTANEFPFPEGDTDLSLLDSASLHENLGTLEMKTIKTVRDCIETAVCLLYNAAIPLDSWNDFKREFERTRNKYEVVDAPTFGPAATPVVSDEDRIPDFTWGEQSTDYQRVLQSAMEYVALFKVNRPVQSDYSAIGDMRHVEEVYLNLLEETYNIMTAAKTTYNGNITESIKCLTEKLMAKVNDAHANYNQALEKMDSAFRSKLLDSLSRVSFVCKSGLQNQIETLEQNHKAAMSQMEHEILKTKKDTYDRINDISKMKVQISKYTKLMKKNGIHDPEDYMTIGDEKIKADSILEHHQKLIVTREQKLKSMKTQIKDLQEILTHQNWSGSSEGATRPRTNGTNSRPGKSTRDTPTSKHSQKPNSRDLEDKKLEGPKQAPQINEVDELKDWIVQSVPTVIGRISNEETFEILGEVRREYEVKLAERHNEYARNIIAERTEIVRVRREFQLQFDQVIKELTSNHDFLSLLGAKQGPVISKVQQMYPVNIKKGMKNAEVQCSLEKPPARDAAARTVSMFAPTSNASSVMAHDW